MDKERAEEIWKVFIRYMKDADLEHIKTYTKKDLEDTLTLFHADRNITSGPYNTIQERIYTLNREILTKAVTKIHKQETENKKRETREEAFDLVGDKIKGHIPIFITTILAGVVLLWIAKKYF